MARKTPAAESSESAKPIGPVPNYDEKVQAPHLRPGFVPKPIRSNLPFAPDTPRYLKVLVNDKGQLRFDYHVLHLEPEAKPGDRTQVPGFKVMQVIDLTELPLE